jgi:hypothetical protein
LSWDGRSNRFETLGTWSNHWHDARFERRWLVAGVAGDLFYVGSKERLSVFVRLAVDEDGRLRVLGVKEIRKPVFGRPIPTPDSIAYTTVEEREDGGHPLQEIIPFTEFRRSHGGHRSRGHHDDWQPRL